MPRNKRKKASDIFKETDYIFAKKIPFEQAFPNIEKVSIEVTEYKDAYRGPQTMSFWDQLKGHSEYPRIRHYSVFPGEYIDCTNNVCFNGGFSIGHILEDMVRKQETTSNGTCSCQGYEGSPQGKRKYGECTHQFEYKILITYKKADNKIP